MFVTVALARTSFEGFRFVVGEEGLEGGGERHTYLVVSDIITRPAVTAGEEGYPSC